ncbi:hypothetical protein TRIP_B170053 [uncultured Desulfatiglans sp.]|uniref:4Fe-4S ferredoxin-type domain-containing protein n=1 Tax=Uncultured Desulfatiglans sp. TaxID=1748965 RepID=A0A653A134_UNCDX|nr:hypothetical protein TRIP_B170053 [uncultured Desulfatiglans sp.]
MKLGEYDKTVLVIGGGPTAWEMSRSLAQDGIPVMVAAPDDAERADMPSGVEWILGAQVTDVIGQVGDFAVWLKAGGKRFERRAGAIILALDANRQPGVLPAGAAFGERIRAMTEAEDVLFGRQGHPSLRRVIVLDRLDGLSTAASHERLLRFAVRVQEECNATVYVLTSQVKVASIGLEILYGRLRDGGGLVVKPDAVQVETGDDAVRIRFRDTVLDEDVVLEADMLVAAEDEAPSPELERLAGVLRIERDKQGFLQADNVLRRPCLTNRRGVLSVGSSAAPSTQWDTEQGVTAATAEIRELYRWIEEEDHPDTILYNRDFCAFCLTCFRVCPHGAIHFTDRPNFLPLACQRCGLCAAACPGEALELVGYEKETFFKTLSSLKPLDVEGSKRIVAIACTKSAGRVLNAAPADAEIRKGLAWVEVQCAGTIRTTSLLRLLARPGLVDGVLVLACHNGNCRSRTGTVVAKNLVESIKLLLRAIGADPGRIGYISTAANDEVELARQITAFRDGLR